MDDNSKKSTPRGKNGKQNKKDENGTRIVMPFDNGKNVYAPAKSREELDKKPRDKRADKSAGTEPKAKFVTFRPAAAQASTRLVMPLDEENFYPVDKNKNKKKAQKKPAREAVKAKRPAMPKPVVNFAPPEKIIPQKTEAKPAREAAQPKPAAAERKRAQVTEFVPRNAEMNRGTRAAQRIVEQPHTPRPVQKDAEPPVKPKKTRSEKNIQEQQPKPRPAQRIAEQPHTPRPAQRIAEQPHTPRPAQRNTEQPKKPVRSPRYAPPAEREKHRPAPPAEHAQRAPQKPRIAPPVHIEKPPADPESVREAKQRIRFAVSLSLAVMGALVCVVILTAFIFSVKKITVVGSSRYDEEYIRSLADVKRGDILLLKNADEIRRRLNANPYIEAEIQKKYPNELVIIVKENSERAYIECMDGCAVIDGEGNVLEIREMREEDKSLLCVKGMGSAGIRLGVCLGDLYDYQAHVLVLTITEIDKAGLTDRIAEIDVENPFGVYLRTGEGILIYIGDETNMADKLLNVVPMCEKVLSMGYGSGKLDLSDLKHPTYDRYGAEINSPKPTDTPAPTESPSVPPQDEKTPAPATDAPKSSAPAAPEATKPPQTDAPQETEPVSEPPTVTDTPDITETPDGSD